jgi:mono/diheme cytochrome c family protein
MNKNRSGWIPFFLVVIGLATGCTSFQISMVSASSSSERKHGDEPVCEVSGISASNLMERGARLYASDCAGCHGRDGKGYMGGGWLIFFSENDQVLSLDSQYLVDRMMNTDLHPMATRYFNNDAAAAISYIRNTFGDQALLVCPEDIQAVVNP